MNRDIMYKIILEEARNRLIKFDMKDNYYGQKNSILGYVKNGSNLMIFPIPVDNEGRPTNRVYRYIDMLAPKFSEITDSMTLNDIQTVREYVIQLKNPIIFFNKIVGFEATLMEGNYHSINDFDTIKIQKLLNEIIKRQQGVIIEKAVGIREFIESL